MRREKALDRLMARAQEPEEAAPAVNPEAAAEAVPDATPDTTDPDAT